METINNPRRLARYLADHHIRECFQSDPPRFLLLHYAPGEFLCTPFSPSNYLQFVVEGDLLLYDMPDESSTFMLQTNFNEVQLLGEMELLDSEFSPFFVEARSDVYTLALYLDQYRDQLLSDPVFLRFICMTLSAKLSGAVRASINVTLKERVCASLRYASPGQDFSGIAAIASNIGVSSRQLLRVLKALCEEGVLEHEKKGHYRILRKP